MPRRRRARSPQRARAGATPQTRPRTPRPARVSRACLRSAAQRPRARPGSPRPTRSAPARCARRRRNPSPTMIRGSASDASRARSTASRMRCSVFGPKPGSARTRCSLHACRNSSTERTPSADWTARTRRGVMPGTRASSAAPSGCPARSCVSSDDAPVSHSSAICFASPGPMPSISVRTPSEISSPSASPRFATIAAPRSYAWILNRLSPPSASSAAMSSSERAIRALEHACSLYLANRARQ